MRDSCATCEILDCHDDDICGLIEFRRKRRSHYAAGSSHQTGAASKRVKHTKTGRPGVGGVGGRPSAVLVHVFLSKLLTRVSKTTLFVWAFFSYWQGRRPLFFGSQKEGAEVVAFRIFADNLFPSTPPPLTPFLLSEGEIINHRTSFFFFCTCQLFPTRSVASSIVRRSSINDRSIVNPWIKSSRDCRWTLCVTIKWAAHWPGASTFSFAALLHERSIIAAPWRQM